MSHQLDVPQYQTQGFIYLGGKYLSVEGNEVIPTTAVCAFSQSLPGGQQRLVPALQARHVVLV